MAEHTVLREESTQLELQDGTPLTVTRRLIDVDAGYASDMTYEEIELQSVEDDGVVTFTFVADDAEKLIAFLKRKF